MLEESCSMANQIIHAGLSTPSRMKNEDFKTAEQKLHTELIIKNEIEVENVPMESQVIHVINNPLIIKDDDMKIDQDHLTIKDENVDDQSFIYNQSNLQNHTGLEIKRDLKESFQMDLASGNSCIKRESSLHTELILKDEDIEEDHNNSNVDEQSFIDQSNLQNHGLEEINKDLEESVPKGPTNDDLRINNESSLRKELKIKDKDVEKTYENSDLDKRQTVIIQSNLNSPKRDQKGCFSCDLCNKKLTTRYGLSNHYRIHKGEKPYAGDCQERPFLCDKCGKKFLRKSQLEKHDDSVHSDEKRFSCNICDKKYTGKYTLSMHIKLFHTGENHKYYSCDICNRKFNYKSALNCHKRTHTGEKPFSCNICNKKFARSHILIDHKLTHTGEKTFLCDVCDKKFSRRYTLIAHKQTHTPESLIKKFACDFCEKKFRLKGTLITHKRLHTGEKPFSCDVCDRKFTTLYSLNSHKLVHTGKKSFFCDVCDKKFSKKHHVTQHKRSHTGEKPYACDVCDKRYFKNQDLVKHKKKHAND